MDHYNLHMILHVIEVLENDLSNHNSASVLTTISLYLLSH